MSTNPTGTTTGAPRGILDAFHGDVVTVLETDVAPGLPAP